MNAATYNLTADHITCHLCGRRSYNPNDMRERYCGRCHVFHDDRGPMSTVIRPSGHCFDDMLAFFLSRDGTAVLVHGILESDGTRYAHAWVEEDGLAWESGIDPDGRQLFYAVGAFEFLTTRHVERCTRYTFLDVVRENRTHGTHGPWEPDYRALCGRGGTILGKSQMRVVKVAR